MTSEPACGLHEELDAEEGLELLDLNNQFVRRVTMAEAAHLVEIGHCDPVIPGGWRDRADIPWAAIRLSVEPDTKWSVTALTSADCLKAVGAIPTDEDSMAKLKYWQEIGDDKAVRVRR
jgi:hypothetical protein